MGARGAGRARPRGARRGLRKGRGLLRARRRDPRPLRRAGRRRGRGADHRRRRRLPPRPHARRHRGGGVRPARRLRHRRRPQRHSLDVRLLRDLRAGHSRRKTLVHQIHRGEVRPLAEPPVRGRAVRGRDRRPGRVGRVPDPPLADAVRQPRAGGDPRTAPLRAHAPGARRGPRLRGGCAGRAGRPPPLPAPAPRGRRGDHRARPPRHRAEPERARSRRLPRLPPRPLHGLHRSRAARRGRDHARDGRPPPPLRRGRRRLLPDRLRPALRLPGDVARGPGRVAVLLEPDADLPRLPGEAPRLRNAAHARGGADRRTRCAPPRA